MNVGYYVRTGFHRAFTLVLDWIFPVMSPEDFFAQATPALDEIPSITSLFSYKDKLVQQAIWELKYKGNRTIAKLLATLLYDHIVETLSENALFENFTHPLLIPIPLSKERLKERGWNQSEMLAQELAALDHNRSFTFAKNILKKKIHTQAQTTLTRSERQKNLRDCFEVIESSKDILHAKNVILLDDVTTTGSTLEEAARTLEQAGARKIIAFTIAH